MRTGIFFSLAVSFAILSGCGGNNQPIDTSQAGQCSKDTDCKGERICDKGTCKAPSTSILPSAPKIADSKTARTNSAPPPDTTNASPTDTPNSFSCGPSRVSIVLDDSSGSSQGHDSATITVKNSESSVNKKFEWVHFSAKCMANAKNQPLIVYQATCGGSSCDEMSGWGIIEPTTLRWLLDDDKDGSSKSAQKILGKKISAPLE